MPGSRDRKKPVLIETRLTSISRHSESAPDTPETGNFEKSMESPSTSGWLWSKLPGVSARFVDRIRKVCVLITIILQVWFVVFFAVVATERLASSETLLNGFVKPLCTLNASLT